LPRVHDDFVVIGRERTKITWLSVSSTPAWSTAVQIAMLQTGSVAAPSASGNAPAIQDPM
jgi:hypothetical protein